MTVCYGIYMNRLDTAKRAQVIAALAEGNSIRSVSRMTDVARNTIAKLLIELGAACSDYMNRTLVNLPCKSIQADEIWSYVGAKDKNVTPENKERGAIGDVWTWVAMDATTKLVCSWTVGGRDAGTAYEFMQDLAGRLAHRVQLTTDGFKAYLNAVDAAFGTDIDYAMLVKLYGESSDGQRRYSPAEVIGTRKEIFSGEPEPKRISTSYIERQNLTMRMSMRRFTRLTNGFSKKIEFHIASIAIHYMHYNFCRIHQTLRCTPAMEAGVSNHVWSVDELIGLLG